MKKYLILFTTCILISLSLASKTSHSPEGNLSETERLFLTCKVWGFLKYYHPKVGTGVYDWDEKLIKVLINSKNITTDEQLSNYFYKWIYAFGPRKPCTSCAPLRKELFRKNFDLSWTQGRPFSAELQATFRDIEKNRFQGDHYYVEMGKSGQFTPKSESAYFDLSLADEKLPSSTAVSLLELCRLLFPLQVPNQSGLGRRAARNDSCFPGSRYPTQVPSGHAATYRKTG